MRSEQEYVNAIASALDRANIKYERERAIGGLRPDFTVRGPKNRFAVIETKAWDPRGGNTARALDLTDYYEKATGADRAFVVVPQSSRNYSRGVVNLDGLIEALQEFFEKSKARRARATRRRRRARRTVFAAMPFARSFDNTFLIAISHAAKSCNAVAERVDHIVFCGNADEEARRRIAASTAVIVDLSGSRPNVLYEAGYAHALEKPTLHICATGLKDLPFNVQNWPTIEYDFGQATALKGVLTRKLRALLKNHGIRC